MPDCAVNIYLLGVLSGNNAGCMGAASLIFKNVI
jgi:hypothetical protein